ncbi:MAG: hypothetical protein QNJ22_01935 [Desulfosarcinaceae bacterium]|nr:hypothetical protein [Desulfosarcinaceae bacterium]
MDAGSRICRFRRPSGRHQLCSQSPRPDVPELNPAGFKTLSDLTAERVGRIAIGTSATAPAGQFARMALIEFQLMETLTPTLPLL